MKSQKKLIKKGDWDCLIVLDACRFDYFKKLYKNYLDGKLEKVISGGCHTSVWLKNIWENKKYNDIVYISASPYVNSQDIEVLRGFNGNDYFHEVVDVWDYGWSEELGTVPPAEIVEATRQARLRHPKKKLVSHFIQPHYPYLSLEPVDSKWWNVRKRAKKEVGGRFRTFVGGVTETFLGRKKTHKIRRLLNLTSPNMVEIAAEKYGLPTLKRAYEENLRIVLGELAKLVKRLPDRCIITADHGELLGEGGLCGHILSEEDNPYLREVPWLVTMNVEKLKSK